jgi:hypothetical protein
MNSSLLPTTTYLFLNYYTIFCEVKSIRLSWLDQPQSLNHSLGKIWTKKPWFCAAHEIHAYTIKHIILYSHYSVQVLNITLSYQFVFTPYNNVQKSSVNMIILARCFSSEGLPNIWGNARIFSLIQYEEAVSHNHPIASEFLIFLKQCTVHTTATSSNIFSTWIYWN